MVRIRLVSGDISEAEVDAIVNAAATDLVALGDARLLEGGALPARYVIQAATMEPGTPASEQAVRAATRRSLEIARERGLRSIAFPALGAGGGALSLQRCAEIMFEEAGRSAPQDPLEEIRFVLLGEPAYRIFEQVQDAERIRIQLERLKR